MATKPSTKSQRSKEVTKEHFNNPYGANQWVRDPRQQFFLAYYLDPKSPTFSNALQSGLKAGFSQEYSESIMSQMPTWLSEKLGNNTLLLKAERNLNEMLDLPTKTQAMGMYGPIFEKVKVKGKKAPVKRPMMVYNKGLLAIKSEVSQFIAETVGKKKFSKKGTSGGNVFNTVIFANDQRARIAKRIIGGGSIGDTASAGISD